MFVTVFIKHELHLDIFDKKMQPNQINEKSYEAINVKSLNVNICVASLNIWRF